MIGRKIAAVLALSLLPAASLRAQDAVLTGLKGQVVAEGLPVDWVVEIRLDSQSSGQTLATAYTLSGGEFEFLDLEVNARDRYFVVIEQEGYEVIRLRLDERDFSRDPRNLARMHFAGLLILYLKPLPPAPPSDDPEERLPAIDIRVLTAEVPDEAREAYESAIEDLADGDNESALRYLETAVELAPDYYDAVNDLGTEYLRAGRYRDAEETLDHARSLNPNDPRPLVNLGTLHFQEGQVLEAGEDAEGALESYRRAVEVLEHAVRLDPLLPESNYYLGSALYKTGNYGRAELLLLEALELDERLHEAHLTLVNVYTRQQRFSAAIGQIDAYLDANPESPERAMLENVKTQIEGVLGR